MFKKILKSFIKDSRPKCPYCEYRFDEMPKRQRKCPACRQVIYRRRLPSETDKILVTKKEAERIDEVWNEVYTSERKIEEEKYLNEFEASLANYDFGSFMYSSLNLGNHYYSDGKYQKSLNYYLIGVYFGMNGAHRNTFDYMHPRIPKHHVERAKEVVKNLKIDNQTLRTLFIKINTVYHIQYGIPVNPVDVWSQIANKYLN